MSYQYPMVRVEWEDATNVVEWSDRETAAAFDGFEFDYHCTSVGYLIRDDNECVVVSGRATGDFKSVGMTERIPRGMVLSITRLVTEEAAGFLDCGICLKTHCPFDHK